VPGVKISHFLEMQS